MINRVLKSSTLSVSYEFLSDEGKVSNKKQNLKFFSQSASDDDKYAVATVIGNILVSSPKSIDDTSVYSLVEA